MIHKKKQSQIDRLLSIITYCNMEEKGFLDDTGLSMLAVIEKKFPQFKNEFFRFISGDANKDISIDQIKINQLMYVAACLEQTDKSHINNYLKFGSSLLTLLGTYENVLKYLHHQVQTKSKLPVHDVCIFQLPEGDSAWDKKYWQKMTMRYGMQAARLMPLAPRLDEIRREYLTGSKQHELLGMSEIQRLNLYASRISYKNAHEHPELAALCMRFNKPEAVFDKCLNIVKSSLKEVDFMPDISFSGKEISPDLDGFRMEKLTASDLRGFFLGEFTGCCQNVGSNAERCAIDGMTSPTSGFYVIYNKNNDIAAQLYTYIGKDNAIIFDSWEPKAPEYSTLFIPFMQKAADIAIAAGFSGARIGAGGRTPSTSVFAEKKQAERGLLSFKAYDSRKQYIIREVVLSPEQSQTSLNAYLQQHGLSQEKYANFGRNQLEMEKNFIKIANTLSSDELYLLFKFVYGTYIGPSAIDISKRRLELELESIFDMIQYNFDEQYNPTLDSLLKNLYKDGHLGKGTLEETKQQLALPNNDLNLESLMRMLALSNFYSENGTNDPFVTQFVSSMILSFCIGGGPEEGLPDFIASNPVNLRKLFSLFTCFAISRFANENNHNASENVASFKEVFSVEAIPYLAFLGILPETIRDAIAVNDADLILSICSGLESHHIDRENARLDYIYFPSEVPDYSEFSLLMLAINSKNPACAHTLLKCLYNQKDLQHDIKLHVSRTDRYTLIENAAASGDHESITRLRSFFSDESEWLAAILRNKNSDLYGVKNNMNAMHLAMNSSTDNYHARLECALAIINSLADTANLHVLLMTVNKEMIRPLDYISNDIIQAFSAEMKAIADAISAAYTTKPELLNELLENISNPDFALMVRNSKPQAKKSLSASNLFSKRDDGSRDVGIASNTDHAVLRT